MEYTITKQLSVALLIIWIAESTISNNYHDCSLPTDESGTALPAWWVSLPWLTQLEKYHLEAPIWQICLRVIILFCQLGAWLLAQAKPFTGLD